MRLLWGLLSFALVFLSLAMAAEAQEKIIFDTDSGFFGDDGAALVMLARSTPRILILGVTTVAGNVFPVEGAAYMLRLLEYLHVPSLPVFVGAQAPLIHTAAMAAEEDRRWGPLRYQGAFAGRATDPSNITPRQPDRRNAVDFLSDTIERHPGEITVLALGPMTNLAIAFRLHPDVPNKIKRLIFMGGALKVPGNANRTAEFNFWFDPEAAQVVLRSAIPEKIMFGLDICNRAPLTRKLFDEIIATKTPVTELYRQDYGERYPGFLSHPDATAYLWDELVAADLIDPSFVTSSETVYLDVDTRFGPNYGASIKLDRNLAPKATPVRVMLDLNYPRVAGLYRDLLTNTRTTERGAKRSSIWLAVRAAPCALLSR